jgi:hypothetical protein
MGATVTEYLLFTGQGSYRDDVLLYAVLLITVVAVIIIVTEIVRQTGDRRTLWVAILLLAVSATTSFLLVR